MTYACAVFAHVKPYRLHRMQTLQNRFLRRAKDAPYYVRNERLHLDLKIPTVQQFMKRITVRFFASAEKHSNPLIVSAARYTASRISKIRRPRLTLTTPDDPITVLQESSRETSTIRKHKIRRPSFRPRRRGPRNRGNSPTPTLARQSQPAC
ncbi:hypothetical protein PYW07_001911 [Mythimna separata]|uniref:Uncharacterized protein n=1 Tax=Mythimna separata TaxID=271217 RepID=A0AAD7YVT6_MYTSE|nr:hypothetical protein PYW07_013171 [Mythimna separata]KAJ8703889.1 hypothetical protein PYW07_013183 [Mythimna separata]KAJ8720048.1 hypothetical protein PYW07_012091 [Mythimna separata]KAJ8727792.1 hypothetical protein PYW07_001911 [Mythimna separata]